MLASKAGLAGCSVSATLIAAGRDIRKTCIEQCRGSRPIAGDALPASPRCRALLLARYLGHSSEAAMHYFIALWQLLRPALAGAQRVPPRIWAT